MCIKGDIVALRFPKRKYTQTFPPGTAGRVSFSGDTRYGKAKVAIEVVYPNGTLGPELWCAPSDVALAPREAVALVLTVLEGPARQPEAVAARTAPRQTIPAAAPVRAPTAPQQKGAAPRAVVALLESPAPKAYITTPSDERKEDMFAKMREFFA